MDVQTSIALIHRFTAEASLEHYEQDDLMRSAVERHFITIGEAIRRMRYVSGEVARRIDDAVRISGFRNILVHEYEQVDDAEVWRVLKQALPRLKQQIDLWAAELGMEASPESAS